MWCAQGLVTVIVVTVLSLEIVDVIHLLWLEQPAVCVKRCVPGRTGQSEGWVKWSVIERWYLFIPGKLVVNSLDAGKEGRKVSGFSQLRCQQCYNGSYSRMHDKPTFSSFHLAGPASTSRSR